MREGNRRTTLKERNKMRMLYWEGLNFSKIGRQVGRHHTTVMFWIKKDKDYRKKNHLLTIEQKKISTPAPVEKPQERDPNLCMVCDKPKLDKKWERSHVCGIACWAGNKENVSEKRSYIMHRAKNYAPRSTTTKDYEDSGRLDHGKIGQVINHRWLCKCGKSIGEERNECPICHFKKEK